MAATARHRTATAVPLIPNDCDRRKMRQGQGEDKNRRRTARAKVGKLIPYVAPTQPLAAHATAIVRQNDSVIAKI